MKWSTEQERVEHVLGTYETLASTDLKRIFETEIEDHYGRRRRAPVEDAVLVGTLEKNTDTERIKVLRRAYYARPSENGDGIDLVLVEVVERKTAVQ